MNDRRKLTAAEVDAMMPPGEYVHVFSNPNGMLIGCDHARAGILKDAEAGHCELAGDKATSMKHGIVSMKDPRMPLFIATKPTEGGEP